VGEVAAMGDVGEELDMLGGNGDGGEVRMRVTTSEVTVLLRRTDMHTVEVTGLESGGRWTGGGGMFGS
jgi:hypothetical protein